MSTIIRVGGAPASGNAVAADLLSGKTASVDAGDITGTMPNNGAVSQSLTINGSYTIPAGYHNGSGVVNQSIPTKSAQTYTPGTTDQTITSGQYLTGNQVISGDADLVAGNIKSGVNIFGVDGTYMPTLNMQYGRATAVNFIGTQTVDKDLGSVRPCYVYAGCFNRYNLWIYGSTNGSTWTQLTTTSVGANGYGELSYATSSYRYIRAAADGVNNGGSNSLFMSVTYI